MDVCGFACCHRHHRWRLDILSALSLGPLVEHLLMLASRVF